ncbi:MAG: molybdenum cofactor biosynthesis protein [Acidimicrobiia bacterium]|nr:MAG: molybdenum cofactor biosynthesis protein [Acidimicrobiia bacterium]
MAFPGVNHHRGTTAAVLTVSDGVAAGRRPDGSGEALQELLEEAGFVVVARSVVPDESDMISSEIRRLAASARLVVTTGGTGLGPRDVTPEATAEVLDRLAPGLVHLMLSVGLRSTPMAALSRGVAGSLGTSLVINLPGSPKGATESLTPLLEVIPHALDLLAGETRHDGEG